MEKNRQLAFFNLHAAKKEPDKIRPFLYYLNQCSSIYFYRKNNISRYLGKSQYWSSTSISSLSTW